MSWPNNLSSHKGSFGDLSEICKMIQEEINKPLADINLPQLESMLDQLVSTWTHTKESEVYSTVKKWRDLCQPPKER